MAVTTVELDDFTGTSLGAEWTTPGGLTSNESGGAASTGSIDTTQDELIHAFTGGGDWYSVVWTDEVTTSADSACEVEVGSWHGWSQALAFTRIQTGDYGDNYYAYGSGGYREIGYHTNGTYTYVTGSTGHFVLSSNDKMGCRVEGTTLALDHEDSGGGWTRDVVTTTDSTWSSAGYNGCQADHGGSSWSSSFESVAGGPYATPQDISLSGVLSLGATTLNSLDSSKDVDLSTLSLGAMTLNALAGSKDVDLALNTLGPLSLNALGGGSTPPVVTNDVELGTLNLGWVHPRALTPSKDVDVGGLSLGGTTLNALTGSKDRALGYLTLGPTTFPGLRLLPVVGQLQLGALRLYSLARELYPRGGGVTADGTTRGTTAGSAGDPNGRGSAGSAGDGAGR